MFCMCIYVFGIVIWNIVNVRMIIIILFEFFCLFYVVMIWVLFSCE